MQHVKFHLRRSISKSIFPAFATSNSIQTSLAEIVTIINSRPITADSANPNDPRPLCPLNFISPLRRFGPRPFPNTDDYDDPNFNALPPSDPTHLLSMWSHLCTASKIFWGEWQNTYLTSLRERYKRLQNTNDRIPKVGELVLIHDANLPQSNWRPALIQSINFRGEEANTATVRLSGGRTLVRSVAHLFPLETTAEFAQRSVSDRPISPPLSHNPPPPTPDCEPLPPPLPQSPQQYLHLRNRKIIRNAQD
jgi:hypothetical protein